MHNVTELPTYLPTTGAVVVITVTVDVAVAVAGRGVLFFDLLALMYET